MIHNSFRRIALAQGLLPTHPVRPELATPARPDASTADTRRLASRTEPATFRPGPIDPPARPSERSVQV